MTLFSIFSTFFFRKLLTQNANLPASKSLSRKSFVSYVTLKTDECRFGDCHKVLAYEKIFMYQWIELLHPLLNNMKVWKEIFLNNNMKMRHFETKLSFCLVSLFSILVESKVREKEEEGKREREKRKRKEKNGKFTSLRIL